MNAVATANHSKSFQEAPWIRRDSHALLDRAEEKSLAQKIERFRRAFQRQLIREKSVLEFLQGRIVACLQGQLRIDMLCQTTLRERSKRNVLLPRLREAAQQLETLLRDTSNRGPRLSRSNWRQWVRIIERLELRNRYFQAAPFRGEKAMVLLQKYRKFVHSFAAANLRLVVSICRKMCRDPANRPDLIQEGYRGLLLAISKFDHRRGVRFSTYATPWIRKSILEAMPNQNRLIRVPDRIREVNQKWLDDQHVGHAHPVSSPEARCSELNQCSYSDSVHYVRVQLDTKSLDWATGGEQGAPRQLLVDPSPAPIETVAASEMRQCLQAELAKLPLRERAVLEQRFGLKDGAFRSLAEVGQNLNYSREHVRQLEKSALRKLANALPLAAFGCP